MKYLNTFSILAWNRNFTRTAESLRIAQPAVSRQIKELERQLGVTLFLRDNKRVELTSAGQALYRRLRPLLENIQHAVNETIDSEKKMSGSLSIACPRELGEFIFYPLIKTFALEHPDLKIELLLGSTAQVESRVLSGEIDFCISFESSFHENLGFEKILEQKSYLMTNSKTNTRGLSIKKCQYIAYKKNDRLLRRFLQARQKGLSMSQIEVAITMNSHQSMVDFLCSRQDLFAVLPYYSRSVKEALDKGKLKAVGNHELDADLYLVSAISQFESRRYQIFREHLFHELKKGISR